MARDLDGILTHIDKLNEADVAGVEEPMAQVLYEAETATLREDAIGATFDSATALSNAPLSGAGQFKVSRRSSSVNAWTSPNSLFPASSPGCARANSAPPN